MKRGHGMDLVGLLSSVFLELEQSTDTEAQALLERLRDGSHTPRDIQHVADLIEAVAQRARPQKQAN